MKSTQATDSKKSVRFITKNLIILLVLVAVCALSIWAWFTKGTTSIANGINIQSKADGVQVSWDGVNYYDNLTALEEASVVNGVTGLAKNISGENGVPEPLKLVTGNGLKFFEPYLNRRTGEAILSGSAWQGVDITSDNSAGRYIDIDLYFRGTSERDIYLAGDSVVSPKSTTDRISEYGPFSKDYIAAASRIAFLTGEGDNQTCSFIWAPNADIELKESEAGYTKVTEYKTGTDTSGSGSGGILNGGATEDGNEYYLWTINPSADYSSGTRQITNSYKFEYDSSIKYYVATFTVIVPSYQAENPSIPFLISSSSTSPLVNTYSFDRAASFNGNDSESLIKVSNQGYNAATYNNSSISEDKCGQFYITKTNTLVQGAAVEVEFGFNPQTGVVTVLGYEGNDSWSKGGTVVPVEVFYYELENNTNCALVNPADSTSVSSGEHYKKAVQFKDSSTKLNVLPVSVSSAEQFTAVKTGDGYEATYKFRNAKTNQCLVISNGEVSFTASGSDFSLYYSTEFEGPMLKSGDYYLVVQNGNVAAVKADELNIEDAVTVYTGSSYELNTGLTTDAQTYQYYDSDPEINSLVTLGSSTSPKLFTSTSSTEATVKIGNTKIVTLTKAVSSDEETENTTEATSATATDASGTAEEDVEYYTAHIVMRIWVEGTDREAKTPLADGIFDMSLHFISQ